MIQGETEADSNQPCPEPRVVAESGKATVRTQNCFLRDVLCVGCIAQDSARNPERQRAALLEALFKLAPKGSFFKIGRQLGLRRATGPGEFLHLFSPYNCQTPPAGFEFDRKPTFIMNAGRVRSCVRSVARSGLKEDSTGAWGLCLFAPGKSSGIKPTVVISRRVEKRTS